MKKLIIILSLVILSSCNFEKNVKQEKNLMEDLKVINTLDAPSPTLTIRPPITPTITLTPTLRSTEILLKPFSIEKNQGLFIVAKVDRDLEVFSPDGDYLGVLISNKFYFYVPTYKNHKIVYSTDENQIIIQDLETQINEEITTYPSEKIDNPVLFPNSEKILYTSTTLPIPTLVPQNLQGKAVLFIDSLVEDTLPISVFNNFDNSISNAEISSDGKWVVFQSDKNGSFGQYNLFLLNTSCIENNVNCDDTLRQITFFQNGEIAVNPEWNPDNTKIAFECLINETDSASESSSFFQSDICVLDINDFQITNITKTSSIDEYFPKWSPDNQMIGFTSNYFDEEAHEYVDEITIYQLSNNELTQITNTSGKDEVFSFWLLLN